jgi:hypothetical protein
MRRFVIVVCLLSTSFLWAKKRKDIPQAPLPSTISNAKTVFLSNGGGSNSDLAYDAFYSEMKTWGKFEIVGTPDKANLIVEFAYRVEHAGTRVWGSSSGSSNTYGQTTNYYGNTQLHSAEIPDPQLILTIYDPTTMVSLWFTVDHRRLARLERNREKETINSAERLVKELKSRIGINWHWGPWSWPSGKHAQPSPVSFPADPPTRQAFAQQT